MHVLIVKEAKILVGQLLEHDICVQGRDVADVMARLSGTIKAEKKERGGILTAIEPAPKACWRIWKNSPQLKTNHSGFFLAMAA